jgi:hypothetical protein
MKKSNNCLKKLGELFAAFFLTRFKEIKKYNG